MLIGGRATDQRHWKSFTVLGRNPSPDPDKKSRGFFLELYGLRTTMRGQGIFLYSRHLIGYAPLLASYRSVPIHYNDERPFLERGRMRTALKEVCPKDR